MSQHFRQQNYCYWSIPSSFWLILEPTTREQAGLPSFSFIAIVLLTQAFFYLPRTVGNKKDLRVKIHFLSRQNKTISSKQFSAYNIHNFVTLPAISQITINDECPRWIRIRCDKVSVDSGNRKSE